jgi:ATP-dependent DNA ligase
VGKERLPEGVVLDGEIIGLGSGLRAAGGGLTDGKARTGDGREMGGGEGAEESIQNEYFLGGENGGITLDFVPLPFAALQTRIGRKNVTKKNLQEVPVGFIAYDLLEYEGQDWRNRSLQERRAQLEAIVRSVDIPCCSCRRSFLLTTGGSWRRSGNCRGRSGSEGIMLKRKSAVYQVGRKRGDWWKWKIDPLVIDAVMVYAQKGHGRRSNLYTDYTFAVRAGDQLVTFTPRPIRG